MQGNPHRKGDVVKQHFPISIRTAIEALCLIVATFTGLGFAANGHPWGWALILFVMILFSIYLEVTK